MRIRLFISVLFISIVQILNAQSDFKPGYIITLQNDTVYGKIDNRGELLMAQVCIFKSLQGEKHDYTPSEIKAFRITDEKYYISKLLNGNMVFLEFLIKGKISIYYMFDSAGWHYYIEKENEKLVELPFYEKEKIIDSEGIQFESKKHQGILFYLMQDAPQVRSEILEMKMPDHQSLIKLASDYHRIVCNNNECIIFEKKQPALRVSMEALSGIAKLYNMYDVNTNRNYAQMGLVANIWFPRTNEKMYIKLGFLRSSVLSTKGEKGIYIKPIGQIAYIGPRIHLLRPTCAVGIISPVYSAGMLVRAGKRLNFGVEGNLGFSMNGAFFIPGELRFASVLATAIYEF
jgi:hypothetical protein